MNLEREVGSILAPAKRVHENLGDEESDGDTDRDLDHTDAKLETARVLLGGAAIILDKATSVTDRGLESNQWAIRNV